MTYRMLVSLLTERENGDANASGDSAELVSRFTGNSREWCLANANTPLPQSVEEAAKRLLSGTPLQYITGRAWFFGDKYFVNSDVLIPQPDTEILVDEALARLRTGDFLLDLCTGSGCIAISILKRIVVKGCAVELSRTALDVARRNAEVYKLASRLDFVQADVLDSPLMPGLIGKADVIVSNPPYIDSDVIETLSPEVRSEPRMALDGGSDGLRFYRRFINDYSAYMKPSAVMLLEIGYDQSERIASLCAEAGLDCAFRTDFGGVKRVAIVSCIKNQKNE